MLVCVGVVAVPRLHERYADVLFAKQAYDDAVTHYIKVMTHSLYIYLMCSPDANVRSQVLETWGSQTSPGVPSCPARPSLTNLPD
jgi:hypothetical protein